MATPTYIPIATTTLSSSASTVSFLGIPQDYRDLVLVFEVTGDGSTGNIRTRFNGDSGSNYNVVAMSGNGSSAQSYSFSSDRFDVGFSLSSTDSGLIKYDILDYSATDKHKSTLVRAGRTGASTDFTFAHAWRYASTSAVSSIEIYMQSGLLASGSTFSIYGIASEVA